MNKIYTCEELLNLNGKSVTRELQNDHGDRYINISLTFRKTNQSDPDKGIFLSHHVTRFDMARSPEDHLFY